MRVKHHLTIRATCPINGNTDFYQATVSSNWLIPVEEVLAAAEALRLEPIFQEDLTKELKIALDSGDLRGVRVKTIGTHSGVRTVCRA